MHSWSHGSKRTLSEEEWETLRPAIQLHYIDENRTFVEVAHILKQKYGFEPTKKQFTTRIQNWGMKKNISRSERIKILQTENISHGPGIVDSRLSPAKLGNWRKRYKHEASRKSGSLNQHSKFAVAQQNGRVTKTVNSNGEYFTQCTTTDVSMENSILGNFDPATASHCKAIEMEILDLPSHNHTPMEIDSWPFDWASVNFLGPAGLTKLFRGLEIECAHSMPQPTFDSQSQDEPICISNTELRNLWNSENYSKLSEMDHISNSWQQCIARSAPQRVKKTLPKDRSAIFFGYMESPYNEIYIFPDSQKTATRKSTDPGITSMIELEAKELDLQSKLRVLKRSLPPQHPVLIATTEELANVCYDGNKFKKSEILFRQVVSAKLKAPGTAPLQILEACMRVAESLYLMDQIPQAQDLFRKIIRPLQKFATPEHKLVTKALYKLGRIAMNLEDYEQAEKLLSQVLQIHLSLRGPRHPKSLKLIECLGDLLERMGRIAESEKLLRTSLQLYAEVEGVKERDVCEAMHALSRSLYSQRSYEESETLARQTLERAERLIGAGDPTTMKAQISLATSLKCLERIPEAKELFQRTYHQSYKILGRKHSLTVNAAIGLAWIQSQDQIEEAMRLYKEILHIRVEVDGPTSRWTRMVYDNLGNCYEKLGFHEDAVKLFTEFVEELRKEDGDEGLEIAKYEFLIEWNRDRIRERGRCA